ncbi:hypothetical protein FRC08_003034 [Ceratobasidium sp. 394]|nr:hypothetical protein FRC08_003034 [Ceratobasidium sp. 394]
MLAAISYGEIACGWHEHDLDRFSIDPDRDYSDYFNSPIIIPVPEIHDLDYFPHRVLVLGAKCVDCLCSRTDVATATAARHASVQSRSIVDTSWHRIGIGSNTHPRSKHPYSIRRPKYLKIQRSRSLTDIHCSLRHLCATAPRTTSRAFLSHFQHVSNRCTSFSRRYLGRTCRLPNE